MSENETGSQHRRRLLKGLLAGGVTSGTSCVLPQKWLKPMVETVYLPAHAMTTDAEEPPDRGEECPALSIPGVTFSCETPQTPSINNYQVDDTGDCPVLLNPSSADGGVSTVIVVQDIVTAGFVQRAISIAGDAIGHGFGNCDTVAFLSNVPADVTKPFEALSGASWTASYTVTGDINGVTVSDITLQPNP